MVDTDEPVLVLIGDRVALGTLRVDLVPLYHRWEQQLAVLAGYGQTTPEPLEARQSSYDAAAQAGDDGAYFTIYAKTGDGRWEPIGTTTLHIDSRKQIADYVIMLGARRGEGLGTEATRLTLDWAFNVAGLRNVKLEVWAPNKSAIRAYEKAGFHHVGVRRNGARWLGGPCDEIIMDAIPEDFSGSVVQGQL
ncbi:MAG TPA: GNAT family protein [Mycobacteriales bacterium]|jgi:RimJ/RimL family protein N-acetyltransferase|nr:GNAT family protein [Mycobacteriales bacterium]